MKDTAKKLIIVESPSKAKTIGKFLGSNYIVRASVGHIRDLPKSKIGFDPVTFEPVYEVSEGKEKVIRELKKESKEAGETLLATDPDREGEAIAWHIQEVLKLKNPKRIVFHEITQAAISEAMDHPRLTDMNLVDAQQARRIFDRIVGYTLSPLLWTKIRYGLSAGRVQSVALRVIVDRERERDRFKPEEYWDMLVLATKDKRELKIKIVEREEEKEPEELNPKAIPFKVNKYKGKTIDIKEKVNIEKFNELIRKGELEIDLVESKEQYRYPKPPFTTSTLQQAAANRFGFTAKRTMQAAQKLYEDGHITYMRTDSVALSEQAISSARGYVKSEYGDKYLPASAIHYKTNSKSAQEAHEAIRPTDFSHIKNGTTPDQEKLYKLIWERALSSQMTRAVIDVLTVKAKIDEFELEARGTKTKFDGFKRVYNIQEEEIVLPFVPKAKDILYIDEIISNQHFTQPPARYTEASLIKTLEKNGIGRPSTYASIISVIQSRGYVEKNGPAFIPTDTGLVVNDFLVKYFESIVDLDFTANMENELDGIANGKEGWKTMAKKFYEDLTTQIAQKKDTIKKEDIVVLGESDEKCPKCESKMLIKLGKYGKFLSCERFPECDGIKSLEALEEITLDPLKYVIFDICELDGGKMEMKKSRYGTFWACENYPKCKNTKGLTLQEKCPDCDHYLVERVGKWKKVFIGCSNYPKCKFIKNANGTISSSKSTKPSYKKSVSKKLQPTKPKITKRKTVKRKVKSK